MKKATRHPVGLAALLFLLISSACAPRATGGTPADIAANVRWRRQQWNIAFADRDSTALAALVEDSAVHVSPQFTHVGRSAYLSVFLRALATRPEVQLMYWPDRVIECKRPNCGIVTEYGRWKESWLENGEATEVSGTYYAIWREHNSQWQIRSEVFATSTCRGRAYCGSRARSDAAR